MTRKGIKRPGSDRGDREARIAILTQAITSAAAIGHTVRTRQAMDLLGVSRPTAIADLKEAHARLDTAVPSAGPSEPEPRPARTPRPLRDTVAKPREAREARIGLLVEALREATARGERFETHQAMALLGVSAPTAVKDLKTARERLAVAMVPEAAVAVVVEPAGTVAPHVGIERAQAIATGVDMMGILARVGDDLDRVVREVGADLEQVRFWLMGGDAGLPLPGRCMTCNQAIADRINRQTPPALIGNMGVTDLGRMYDSLIKALRALTEVAAEKNSVLEQFYHYQALQNFMSHTEQAIKEVAPHLAVAIAKRMRELGERG